MKTGLSSLAYLSTASTVPLWISNSAEAVANSIPDDRILVVLQMAGGNDGLNTVIPFTDPKYADTSSNALRPNLHIVSGLQSTELGDGLNAFHPKLARVSEWFQNGNVAVVQNVGYPNPTLSHFLGTEFWELGISPGSNLSADRGWAARYYDNMCDGLPPAEVNALTMMAASLGRLPKTLSGSQNYLPPAVRNFNAYQIRTPLWPTDLGSLIREYIEIMNSLDVPVSSSLDFIQRASTVAQVSVDDLKIAASTPRIHSYPTGSNTLGPGLEMVSRIIRTEVPKFSTKIFYVTQNGYDTHANQSDGSDPANRGAHPLLLEEFDRSVDAFLQDLADSGNLDRVVLLTFSEFGRRPQENGSNGTDHGTANCLFAFGGRVLGGVYGGQPDLSSLSSGNQGGNLKHAIDFRSVYSVVLRDWLNVDPELVFGQDFTDPAFGIDVGMVDTEFIGSPPITLSTSGRAGIGAAAALTAAVGAAAIHRLAKDTPATPSVETGADS
jgi:uncharacterized protein (DUF1501 family)